MQKVQAPPSVVAKWTTGNYVTAQEISQGLATTDDGQVVNLTLPILQYALKFRAEHSVLEDHPHLYIWIHDAIHGWLQAPPTSEGEARVRKVQELINTAEAEEFDALVETFTPLELIQILG